MIIKFQKLVLMLYVSIEYFVLIFSCYLLSRTPFQKPFGSSEKPRSCPTLFQETCYFSRDAHVIFLVARFSEEKKS